MSTQDKPREFYVDENSGTCEVWEDHWDDVLDAPTDDGHFHVIEYSAFQKAVEALKRTACEMNVSLGVDCRKFSPICSRCSALKELGVLE